MRTRLLAVLLALGACSPAPAAAPKVEQTTPATAPARIVLQPATLLDANAFNAAVGVVRQRIDLSGINGLKVRSEGDRIIVEKPKLTGDEVFRLSALLSPAGALSIHLVDTTADPATWKTGESRDGRRLLASVDPQTPPQVIMETPIVRGEDLSFAVQVLDSTGAPGVNFVLKPEAAKAFGEATTANIGRAMAIVIDDQIVSAPRIATAITGGTVQISGMFTLPQAQALALILRAGKLPSRLNVIEIASPPG